MARNAMLSRMETICTEVMGMPEIFLEDDDETDDNDGLDEPDEELVEDIPADADEDLETEDAENSSDKIGNRSDKEKGVSVKVNCDDKKQQRYAKWISRALRAAVNPIVSRFNLNLKVNLDLNVANKGKTSKETDDQSKTKPAECKKPNPTPDQLRRRAELTRIRELEKENKSLEKVFRKIVSEYTDMKNKLTQKSGELEEYQQKLSCMESKISQLTASNSSLEKKIATERVNSSGMQENISKLKKEISNSQNEVESSNKQIVIKTAEVERLENKLAELQKRWWEERLR
ncbi:MATH and LRR domain-containing protein PFE0570w-like isoform X2 [Topomyia yanbarensis]|uniref:MATH and LRR domain-containing protein PFE0570w-like isoform X2 n=1 Tax=Topomyia yanbarensis TaxID=2498891 RepID=UPI00273BD8FB|nr:MATH and LRR domain-containing protein PFE0570w-like isoform X2 [Topomyia yanbarensis]XP_058831013.1 MATH and LRR domain-containing protein PFE0570w-like isoform X2 [Topomyia yanbarensis]